MIDYHYLISQPRVFRNVVGMPPKKFHKLVWRFSKRCIVYRRNRPVMRTYGAGRPPKVFRQYRQLLFYLLLYVRIYPTFDLAQCLFELDRSNLCRWWHTYLPLLEDTLRYKIQLPPEPTTNLGELFKKIPDLKEHIVDATEQPMNRPKYHALPYFSSHKQRYTRKRQIICTPKSKLIGISYAVPGSMHDKKLADRTQYLYHAPPKSVRLADGAYQGTPDYGLPIRTLLPNRKPPGKPLADLEKVQNRQFSALRVTIEHVIAHLKISRIFSDKTRYRKPIADPIATVVGGLYNYQRNY